MYKSMTPKLCVVNKYHTPIISVLHFAYDVILITGCEKALQLAFSNRQVVGLPNYSIKWRAYKRSECVSHFYIGGSSKGASRFMFISPLGEKKL